MRHTPHHTFAPGVIFLTLRRSQWQQTIIPENYGDQFWAGNYCPLSITLLTKTENLCKVCLDSKKERNTFRCIAPRCPTGIDPWDSVFWVRTQSRRGSYRTGGLMVCVNFLFLQGWHRNIALYLCNLFFSLHTAVGHIFATGNKSVGCTSTVANFCPAGCICGSSEVVWYPYGAIKVNKLQWLASGLRSVFHVCGPYTLDKNTSSLFPLCGLPSYPY